MKNDRTERALAIIDRLRTNGNINNREQGILRRSILLPERSQGEWLPNYTSQFMNPGRQCNLCGKIVEFSENYCPQCGAYMRGDKK